LQQNDITSERGDIEEALTASSALGDDAATPKNTRRHYARCYYPWHLGRANV